MFALATIRLLLRRDNFVRNAAGRQMTPEGFMRRHEKAWWIGKQFVQSAVILEIYLPVLRDVALDDATLDVWCIQLLMARRELYDYDPPVSE
jgi:hypothetical protein